MNGHERAIGKEMDQVGGAGSKRRHAKENRMSDGKNVKRMYKKMGELGGVELSQENHSWGD